MTWWDTHQVTLYVAGMIGGAVLGLTFPSAAAPAEALINPSLALLLYATFLGLPFTRLLAAFRDLRFLSTVLVSNFLLVPVIVYLLTRPIADDRVLLVGICLVLLAPCIDYVIVFTGLAGGAKDRLLAATPVLMLAQMALLPLYLSLLVDASVLAAFDARPFVDALLQLIVLPLAAAVLTQALARRWEIARRLEHVMAAAMVPLMVLTLATIVASQIHGVGQQWSSLMLSVPVYVAFAVVMGLVGWAVARVYRQDTSGTRAVIFSSVTRNSLVILPIGLAMPAGFELVPLVIVTQTLVELIAMVIGIRLVPRLVR